VFVGGSHHPPNSDAILYFLSEIFPLIQQKIPQIKFHLVGGNPIEEITALASENIIIHGYVEDLNKFLEGIRISVAPMRFGAGMKGKVCTTLGCGVPTIGTKIGFEGMGYLRNLNLMLADTVSEMAEKVCQIYLKKETWCKLSKESVVDIYENNGPIKSLRRLEEILVHIGIDTRQNNKYPINLYKNNY
jgi:glycosyltransferase involved in cell wall biosynthesis